jgi:hypothetical protein
MSRGTTGWGLTDEAVRWITERLPANSHILELGSGEVSTGQLSRRYFMTSVENNLDYVNMYPSRYIYAPKVGSWYDVAILRTHLPRRYDLLLVDGPEGSAARRGFLDHLELFRTDVPIVIDDTWRDTERVMSFELAALLKAKLLPFGDFSVLLPRESVG